MIDYGIGLVLRASDLAQRVDLLLCRVEERIPVPTYARRKQMKERRVLSKTSDARYGTPATRVANGQNRLCWLEYFDSTLIANPKLPSHQTQHTSFSPHDNGQLPFH